jgi:putative FmdB family regulatory protein
MPVFDFTCRGCGHAFEQLVRAADTPTCPSCASLDVEKLISLPALKTSGTKALAMAAAKRRDKAQGFDRMHEQAKYEASHDD